MKISNEFSAAYNRVREANRNRSFDRQEILDLLTKNVPDFPKTGMIITIFVKKGILIKEGEARNTTYRFTDSPVYIVALSTCISELREYFKKTSRNRYQRNKMEKDSKTLPTEEFCIKFLKERGYRIMREITTFEEV